MVELISNFLVSGSIGVVILISAENIEFLAVFQSVYKSEDIISGLSSE